MESKRLIADIIRDLSAPIDPKYLESRVQGKTNVTYVPWHHAVRLLECHTRGCWNYSITQLYTTEERIFLIARIEIVAEDGIFFREGTGTEVLKEKKFNRDTQSYELSEIAYGDPSSNAESMALRRAAAKFGLGLHLYDKNLPPLTLGAAASLPDTIGRWRTFSEAIDWALSVAPSLDRTAATHALNQIPPGKDRAGKWRAAIEEFKTTGVLNPN